MGQILAYIAADGGKVKRSSLEVLTRCREIARAGGHRLTALVFSTETSAVVETVRRYGPDEILTVTGPEAAGHRNAVLLDVLARAVEETSPSLVAMASSEAVKDVLGALAVRCGASVISDISGFEVTDGGVEAVRPVLASKYLARVRADGQRVAVSVRAGTCEAVEDPGSAPARELTWDLDPTILRSTVREIVQALSDSVDLSEADVVVAAGRGVKDEAGRALVEELARILNGAVGSSRAVVETGLFPADSQIGQTGKVVSPALYFAVGLSGAIQHVAGMVNSKVIVAINRDAEAPIFSYATYGIVGDLFKVMPLLIEEIQRTRAAA